MNETKNAPEFSAKDRERKITLKAGDEAPGFTLENADGTAISLKDFAGKTSRCIFIRKITLRAARPRRANLAPRTMILSPQTA